MTRASKGQENDAVVIFMVRSYNDIDHFTPLIDKYSKETGYQTKIYCLDWSYDLDQNENIQYLRREYGLACSHLWKNSKKLSSVGVLICSIECLNTIRESLKGRWSKLYSLVNRLILWLYLLLPISRIRKDNPNVIVFDHLNAGAYRNRKIVTYAARHNVKTFCLPHGIVMYSNKYFTKKQTTRIDSSGYAFDYYFGTGTMRAYLRDRGIPEEIIVELGSLRYCREWVDIYNNNIVARDSSWPKPKGDRNILRVVMFLSQPRYNVDEAMLSKTVALLADSHNVRLVIKPHTRYMGGEFVRLVQQKTNISVVKDTHSMHLIEWADAVISYGSSIAIQVLLNDKLLIYPNYIDSNNTHYDDRGACLRVSSLEELDRIIELLGNSGCHSQYPKENVSSFLEDVVYAGAFDRNVIEDHFNFINSTSGISR